MKIKVEKKDEDEGEAGKPDGEGVKVKEEEEEEVKKETLAETKPDPEMGRLVMTINGQQKQLSFGRCDLLTGATMLDGDKVCLHCSRPHGLSCSSSTCGSTSGQDPVVTA